MTVPFARRTHRTTRIGGMTSSETLRAGTCPEHGLESTDFVGANEHGWIFKCKGAPLAQENSWFRDIAPGVAPPSLRNKVEKPRPIGHLFVNKATDAQ